jgi:nitroreductase
MSLLEKIRRRRSIGHVKPDMPPREWIEQMLEAAVWAPNHHHTEPWRFHVLTGEARHKLGVIFAEIELEKLENKDDPVTRLIAEKAAAKPLRAPVVITAIVEPQEGPKVEEIEEICAVAAGIQNMLLVADELGLGAIWRSGDAVKHPKTRQFFGVPDKGHILGFIYVGYPDMPEREGVRTPHQEKTVWHE